MSEIVIYDGGENAPRIEVQLDGETVWLTQAQMASLFNVKPQAITKHISNIYATGELDIERTCSKMEQVRNEGSRAVRRFVKTYNLDMVISVGYRVNSQQATRFRQWATGVLREYLVKGFAMDDDRLKGHGGGAYWRELLDRIRDIRSSEKVLYRQVLDLYATAVDYDPHAEESVRFFKIVQNKMHFAAHGHTAAEVIWDRADGEKDFMGLTTFRGDQVTLADAKIAKNYLDEDELRRLNNLVSAYFDLAETNAMDHRPMYMQDYVEQLDGVFRVMGRGVLAGAGNVSHAQAMRKAEEEYRKYDERTLSPVEKAYLETLRQVEEKLPGKNGLQV